MNDKGRIENVIKNSSWSLFVQITNILTGFIVRMFFIHYLGKVYLGVGGLFTNVLTVLSMAEMGIGSAIAYNMYKPIAEKDYIKIAQLMNFFKKAYITIGIFIGAIGLILTPFLSKIINGADEINNLTVIYWLYLFNTVFSYLLSYKKALFNADQRDRVLQVFRFAAHMVMSILQIIIIVVFRNFILYLSIQIMSTVLENIVVSFYADKCYPFLKKYKNETLSKEEKKTIFENIKSLFIYKLGGTALDGTDNIIISATDNVVSVGMLSNYTLITSSVQALITHVTKSMTGSVGNFIAKEKEERYEPLLNKVTFLNFILYGITFVGGVAVVNPTISLFFGKDYVLDYSVLFIHCLNIYILGMMNAVWIFRSTMGLFVHGKWRPLISAVINLVISIWLGNVMGLIGVLIGTTITRVVTNVWYDPLIVYKHGIKKKPYSYYIKWLIYLGVCLVDIFVINLFSNIINLTGIIAILVYGVLAVLIFIGSVYVLFSKTSECKYLIKIACEWSGKLIKRRIVR